MMRKKKDLQGVAKPERVSDVLKRVSGRTDEPQKVTKERIKESADLILERAKDHAARGGKRGIYQGETLRTPVALMVDPTKGYVEGNVEIVHLGISLLYELGFSLEDILDFVLRKPAAKTHSSRDQEAGQKQNENEK